MTVFFLLFGDPMKMKDYVCKNCCSIAADTGRGIHPYHCLNPDCGTNIDMEGLIPIEEAEERREVLVRSLPPLISRLNVMDSNIHYMSARQRDRVKRFISKKSKILERLKSPIPFVFSGVYGGKAFGGKKREIEYYQYHSKEAREFQSVNRKSSNLVSRRIEKIIEQLNTKWDRNEVVEVLSLYKKQESDRKDFFNRMEKKYLDLSEIYDVGE
jgi:hypothetical protein